MREVRDYYEEGFFLTSMMIYLKGTTRKQADWKGLLWFAFCFHWNNRPRMQIFYVYFNSVEMASQVPLLCAKMKHNRIFYPHIFGSLTARRYLLMNPIKIFWWNSSKNKFSILLMVTFVTEKMCPLDSRKMLHAWEKLQHQPFLINICLRSERKALLSVWYPQLRIVDANWLDLPIIT
jgi:hypothetical protein